MFEMKPILSLSLTLACISECNFVKNGLGFGVGGDESSPDEEEDSTLKCSGTAWSGSDSAPRHRSSSTSEFSNSTSSEGEADDLDRPPHKPCRPSEGVLPFCQEFLLKAVGLRDETLMKNLFVGKFRVL